VFAERAAKILRLNAAVFRNYCKTRFLCGSPRDFSAALRGLTFLPQTFPAADTVAQRSRKVCSIGRRVKNPEITSGNPSSL